MPSPYSFDSDSAPIGTLPTLPSKTHDVVPELRIAVHSQAGIHIRIYGEIQQKIGTSKHVPSPYSFDSDSAPIRTLPTRPLKTHDVVPELRIEVHSQAGHHTYL